MQKMIGEKIRALRIQKKMTQAELAGSFITRNMLSQIENGVAMPSVPTVLELAERLDVPASYFFSDAGTLDDYRKIGALDKIKKLYAAKEYEKCLGKLRELSIFDDETEMLYAWASLSCGIEKYRAGYLKSARSYFEEALTHSQKSLYGNPALSDTAAQYLDAVAWIRAGEKAPYPRTERDTAAELGVLADLSYIQAVAGERETFEYGTAFPMYADHLKARADMQKGNYRTAAQSLKELVARDGEKRYAVMKYYALHDLESCSSREGDYNCAYECASAGRALAEKMNK